MTYVMSDIHGNKNRFHNMLKQICLTEDDHLFVLGDVIDRNLYGIDILIELMEMPNATVLLGNHELMMLEAFQNPNDYSYSDIWFRNGGNFTLHNFQQKTKEEQQKVLDFIYDMPVVATADINGQNFTLVHSMLPELYLKPNPTDEEIIDFVVWERMKKDTVIPHDTVVVFGHTPTKYYQDCTPLQIWHADRKIGIDCGAAFESEGCCLACLRLEDLKEYYVE